VSRHGDVTITWGDGERTFRLAIGQLRELEEKCNAGFLDIFYRLINRKAYVDDVYQTIRLGLIGGGATPVEALTLCARYVEGAPWIENVAIAIAILGAAIIGPEDDQPKKKDGVTEQMEQSSSTPSMEMQP
jgi:hypothetical protein